MPEVQDSSCVLFYAPRTRAFTALWLFEELGVDYRLESFELGTQRHKGEDFLALNPMGKVPLVVDDGVAVSETGAIAIYMADRYPESGLAPAFDDRDRPAFLRWVFFASAIMEPALAEKLMGWEARPSSFAWGSFAQMFEVLNAGLASGPWLLGERFTAADVLVGAGLRFGHLFGAIPREGPGVEYVARLTARDAFSRASVIDAREDERFPRG